jgi:ADP-ribose pyrophosphatase
MSSNDARVLSSRLVYAGRVFDLNVDEVELATGVVAQREVVRHPGAVAMVPVTGDGKILMVTQYRHPAGVRMLEIPAGTLTPGEDPLAAAERELQEEVDRRPGRIEPLGGFYVAPSYCDEFIHIYLCTELEEGSLPGDEDEDIEVESLTLDEALAAIADGRIADAKTIVGLLLWSRRAARS